MHLPGRHQSCIRSTQAPELAAGRIHWRLPSSECVRAANVNEQCVVEQHAVYFNKSITTLHVTETDQLTGCCIACGEYTRSVRSRQAGRASTDVERCNLWTWCAGACSVNNEPGSKMTQGSSLAPKVPQLGLLRGQCTHGACCQSRLLLWALPARRGRMSSRLLC